MLYISILIFVMFHLLLARARARSRSLHHPSARAKWNAKMHLIIVVSSYVQWNENRESVCVHALSSVALHWIREKTYRRGCTKAVERTDRRELRSNGKNEDATQSMAHYVIMDFSHAAWAHLSEQEIKRNKINWQQPPAARRRMSQLWVGTACCLLLAAVVCWVLV